MTLLSVLATSSWWWFITAFALVSIYWSECSPSGRRLVLACGMALMMSVGLSAAIVPNIDYCAQLTPADLFWWLIPCFFA